MPLATKIPGFSRVVSFQDDCNSNLMLHCCRLHFATCIVYQGRMWLDRVRFESKNRIKLHKICDFIKSQVHLTVNHDHFNYKIVVGATELPLENYIIR